MLQNITKCYKMLQNVTQCYKLLQNFTIVTKCQNKVKLQFLFNLQYLHIYILFIIRIIIEIIIQLVYIILNTKDLNLR